MECFKTAVSAVCIALLVAAFSQSCSVSKAGHTILPGVRTYRQPAIEFDRPLKFIHPVSVNDSPKKRPTKDTTIVNKVIIPIDTVNYNKLLLESQKAGNEMTSQILALLLNKEKENKNLKVENKILENKVVLTDEQKDDSRAMRAIWEAANYIMSLIGLGVILLMVWSYFLAHRFNKKVRAPLSSSSNGR